MHAGKRVSVDQQREPAHAGTRSAPQARTLPSGIANAVLRTSLEFMGAHACPAFHTDRALSSFRADFPRYVERARIEDGEEYQEFKGLVTRVRQEIAEAAGLRRRP